MRKTSKIATAISVGMIVFGIFMFLIIHPFIYIYIGIIEQAKTTTHHTKWDKLAVKYSIFSFQKKYTMDYALSSLILTEDYDTALDYIHKLEKLKKSDVAHKYFASYAYLQKQDFKNALKYAKWCNSENQLAKIYIKTRDIKNAQKIVDKMLNKKNISPNSYVYKSELEMLKGNWHEADKYADKVLKINPKHREALKDKIQISKHFNRLSDVKKYEKTLKQLELKYSERVR